MNDNIRKIVSQFIKVSPDQITDNTMIDRGAVGSSVIFHRMFSKLAEAGMVIQDYHSIKTFGDLFKDQNIKASVSNISSNNSLMPDRINASSREVALAVGIDMENINAMPLANDFREEAFYQQNFTSTEISYCILQQNPYASFAGLFAAKEAILKTDNRLMELPFNKIEIKHDLRGKPFFKDYAISISHTAEMAVSIAMNNAQHSLMTVSNNLEAKNNVKGNSNNQNLIMGIAALALIVSLTALGLTIFKAVV